MASIPVKQALRESHFMFYIPREFPAYATQKVHGHLRWSLVVLRRVCRVHLQSLHALL